MFNKDDYTDNIDCCEYVFNKNQELGLALETREDIQSVANMYADELQEYDIYQFEENDEILLDVVSQYELKKAARKQTDVYYEMPELSANAKFVPVDDLINRETGASGIDEFYDEVKPDEESESVLDYLREYEGFDDGREVEEPEDLDDDVLPYDDDNELHL